MSLFYKLKHSHGASYNVKVGRASDRCTVIQYDTYASVLRYERIARKTRYVLEWLSSDDFKNFPIDKMQGT